MNPWYSTPLGAALLAAVTLHGALCFLQDEVRQLSNPASYTLSALLFTAGLALLVASATDPKTSS